MIWVQSHKFESTGEYGQWCILCFPITPKGLSLLYLKVATNKLKEQKVLSDKVPSSREVAVKGSHS